MKNASKSLLLSLCWLLLPYVLSAQKTDRLFMKNGDDITCEFTKLEYGKLQASTDDIGTIKVDWEAIDSLWSDRTFAIRLKSGELLNTTLDTSVYATDEQKRLEVVSLIHFEKTFWSRIDGSVDIGFNYTRSSNIFQLNLNGEVSYRSFRNETILKASTISTLDKSAEEAERTRRKNYSLTNNFDLNHNNLIVGVLGYDQLTDLGIQGRLYLAGGFGKDFLHEQSSVFFAGIGIQSNREWSTDGTSNNFNAEGVVLLEFKKYSYNFPELDITTDLKLYPGLSDWGRVRLDFNSRVRVEVIDDFFLGTTVYLSIDNQPIDITASELDWGVAITVGYSF